MSDVRGGRCTLCLSDTLGDKTRPLMSDESILLIREKDGTRNRRK